MSLPRKISPCPLIDALVEIRFKANIHPSTVFGVLYNSIKNDYPKVENLPILQLPEPIRALDPTLLHKPHYKVSNKDYAVQIGPDVITISAFPNYTGWSDFSDNIFQCIETIEKLNVIDSVMRLSIRYINFFTVDIFEKIKLKININDQNIDPNKTLIKTEIKNKKFQSTLQVSNNVKHDNQKGSIIDIDTSLEMDLDNFFKDKKKLINEEHLVEKELFFSLLKEDFLNELNPEN